MTHKSDIWPGDPGYQINVQKIQAAISDMATVTVRGGGQYTQVSTRVEAFRRHVGANVSIETDLVVDDGKRWRSDLAHLHGLVGEQTRWHVLRRLVHPGRVLFHRFIRL